MRPKAQPREGEAPAEPRRWNFSREGEAPAEPRHGSATELPQRHHPAHGVLTSSCSPTIVFLTVCTKDRTRWVADPQVHELLRAVWMDAKAWLVGRYVLMPDHVHLFCAPDEDGSAGALRPGSGQASPSQDGGSAGAAPARAGGSLPSLDNWVQYWKSQFSKRGRNPERRWQPDHWDTRLRHEESYDAKWEYVRNNPVRARLVVRPEDWPYSGELNSLRW